MKFVGKKEKYIIIAVVIACAVSYLIYIYNVSDDKDTKAEIYYYSRPVMTIDLNKGEERSFSIPQKEQVKFRLYEDGSIAFTESDCPDKVCIHTGKIHMPGQTAACLPNGIVVKIVSSEDNKESEPDIIIGNS